ncbi:MAG: transglycosylase domain-containing protein, partial [Rhodobacterales bacterium]|nr:transglycosylase domain-containing protein [Rhodobacterales bacterium]
QGASTITQQLARDLYLTKKKLYSRKFIEILLANKIESQLPKEKILEVYMNQIYLGQKAYGFEAAAETYFGKPLKDLSIAETAMLAGLPQNPAYANPISNLPRAQHRQLVVLERMRDTKLISTEEYEAAKSERLHIRSPQDQLLHGEFAAEMVRQVVYAQYGEDSYTRGLKVYTTLVADQQIAAYKGLRKTLMEFERRKPYRGPEGRVELGEDEDENDDAIEQALTEHPDNDDLRAAVVMQVAPGKVLATLQNGDDIAITSEGLRNVQSALSDRAKPELRIQRGSIIRVTRGTPSKAEPQGVWVVTQAPEAEGAFIAMEPGTGRVRALVGGFDFARNKFNHVTQAWRQPGSSFKPILYSAALEIGVTPNTVVSNAPISIGGWEPKNAENDAPLEMTLKQALAQSMNLVSVRVMQQVTPTRAKTWAGQFGLSVDKQPDNLTLALGSGSVTPMQMASAYSVFANGGYLVQPLLISSIVDDKDKVLVTTAPDPLDDAYDFDDLFGPEAGGFGGRMRPGMGGGAAGGMGGMGAGMGMGLGMGGGMGGMMGMGAMGGGMGGMGGGMMGGMMGMRGRHMQETREKELGPTQFPLFNPDLLFRAIYFTLWPLKFLLWTLLPITVFSGLTLIQKMPEAAADLGALMASSGLIVKLLVGLFVDNFGSRIAQGVAITAHGGRVKSMGLNLVLGFSPRFYIDDSAVEQMDRRGQIWAHGAPLLFRLSLFVFGILIWAVTRESGGQIPVMALTVAKFGLIMFTLTAWPLIPHDGMRFMGAVLGEPKILSKALMAARGLFVKGRLPPMITRDEAWPLALYAVGTILTTVLVMGVTAIFILMGLQGTLGGLGVIIFLGLMTIATLWFMAMFRLNQRKMKARGFGGMGAMGAMAAPAAVGGGARAFRGPDPAPGEADRPAARPLPAAAAAAAGRPAPGTDVERLPNRARVVWSLILCSLLVAAFLPYRYEAGGPVEILPAARGTAVARTDGEIVEVYVAQGDRVTRGTPLARLSDWDQLSNISITEAQLAGARAELARLEAGAQPEEIDLARAKLARSEATAVFKKAEVERARSLIASQTVSTATLDKAEADYAAAVADVEADRASLALTLAGATAEELAIAGSDVDRLERELAYDRDELERTRILAPVDGVVVTADLHLRVGDYLKTGDEFLEIEQTDVVTATISIPEADVAFITPGQQVRLRAESQSQTEVLGQIKAVSPVAEDAGYGRVVRATAEFPNESGILRSSMTGWAKVEGDDMLAWEAYLRTIVRFVQIDVWSWIP